MDHRPILETLTSRRRASSFAGTRHGAIGGGAAMFGLGFQERLIILLLLLLLLLLFLVVHPTLTYLIASLFLKALSPRQTLLAFWVLVIVNAALMYASDWDLNTFIGTAVRPIANRGSTALAFAFHVLASAATASAECAGVLRLEESVSQTSWSLKTEREPSTRSVSQLGGLPNCCSGQYEVQG